MNQQASTADTAPDMSGHILYDDDFLETLRRQMLKFASLQLSDGHLAEDAVQEALIGALRNAKSFSGRSALQTWVFAILKNKIADLLRQRQRVVDASSLLHEDEEDEDFAALFNRKGFWGPDDHPTNWGNPHETLRESQFWRVIEACLEGLPANQARVFMMREFVELDSGEICASVGISTSNLNVMLYRARMRLRECLENRWFVSGEHTC